MSGSRADAGNFAHPLGRVVEHFAESVAEVFGDSARTYRTDAFYFRGKVAFDRDGSRRPQRFVIDDVELFAEALMLLEAALRADGRADFEPGEIADYGDAAIVAMLERYDDDGHRVAVLVIDEQDLVENALERLVRFNCTSHGKRITRAARGVQLNTMRASTGAAFVIGEDFSDLVSSHADDHGVGVQVIRQRDESCRQRPAATSRPAGVIDRKRRAKCVATFAGEKRPRGHEVACRIAHAQTAEVDDGA